MDWRFNRMDNINKQSMKEIETILLQDPRFISADGILLKNKVISRFSYFVPSFIISKFVGLTLISFPSAVLTIQKTIDVYVVLVIVMVLSAFISSRELTPLSLKNLKLS